MLWFRQTKPAEELYDCVADPFQFNNLASDPAYTKTLTALRKAYDEWITQVGDLSEMTEREMLNTWWNGKAQAPKTETPSIKYNGSKVTLSSPTIGASIGYKFYWKDTWSVFTMDIEPQAHDSLYVVAQRIGYEKSDVLREVLKKK
jgi:N-sulfoglucosamine sulfohydrolase